MHPKNISVFNLFVIVMIKENFNAVIRHWLDSHPDDRDYAEGAMILLRIDRNRIRYNTVIRNPKRYAAQIEADLRAIYEKRINAPTEEEKQKIRDDARQLLAQHDELKKNNPASEFKAGKRGDHDSLPEYIQKIYSDNLELRRSMQQYHLQIRQLLKSKRDCAPEDLRDLCALIKKADVKYHDNWKAYDAYGKE